MSAIDAAGHGGKLCPEVKLLMALSYIIAVLISSPKNYTAWGALGALILVTLLVGKAKASAVAKRLLAIIPFIILCALGLLVGGSFERFTQVVVKSTLCVAAATWLSLTTPFSELLAALRALRVPNIMVMMLALLYRYTFVLGEEATRMQRAFTSRCPRKLSISDARYIGMLTGALLIRAHDRADRIFMAMLSRAFDGEFRAIISKRPRSIEWLILLCFASLALAISLALR
ncbi:MAG: energy-coupling factor transporter transmembrane component T [Armatimonadota bacterium]|nr:energy-coupling factor transporter transmembrane protein EcfT [Armatimonadota bacterium]MCX7777505.1 energy-coupling factor transporter transmembrane protein EcfT [Armatimonadota bacterium]MDW8025981.1 energy-coupling factor transporter transmembrane component T [Armatimonadota bacterium]